MPKRDCNTVAAREQYFKKKKQEEVELKQEVGRFWIE